MDKNILYQRTATQLNILKAFGASPDLQKAVSEVFEKGRTQSGVYANTSENRKLGRVGRRYDETQAKKTHKFKSGEKAIATLYGGKKVEVTYNRPSWGGVHLVNDDKGSQIGIRAENLTPIRKEKTKTETQGVKTSDLSGTIKKLGTQLKDLKAHRKQLLYDQEMEVGALGEEMNNGNNPTVKRYGKALEKLDSKIDKVSTKLQGAQAKNVTNGWTKTVIQQYGGTKFVPKRIQTDIKDMVGGLSDDIVKVASEYQTKTGKALNLSDPKVSQALLNGSKTDAIGKTLSGLKSYKKLRNSINEIHSYLTDDMEDGWDD